jgi:hypothetical protein
MKIGNKYWYYSVDKKPIEEDFETYDIFLAHMCAYKINNESEPMYKAFIPHAQPVGDKLKTWIERVEKTEITIDKIIKVERWDGNGIPDKVRVIKIEEKTNSIKVICDKGWFKYSKKNCKKDNIDFNWTCKGKKWQKEYMKWVNGEQYYYKRKNN